MADRNRTKKDLIEELSDLRQQLCNLKNQELEHSRSGNKLQDSETKYRTLFDSSQDAIMMLSPPDWTFTDCNSATVRMFRCRNAAEFTSLGPADLSPLNQPDGQRSCNAALKEIKKAMRTGSNLFEWVHKRTDGQEFPVTVLLSRIELDGMTMLQATVRDISKRKHTEEELRKHRHHLEELVSERTAELRESEEKYRTLVERSHDGIYIYRENNFLFVNDRVSEFTGYSKEELYNLNFWQIIHPDDRERIFGYAKQRVKGKNAPNVYQTKILTKSGEARHLELSVSIITYQGKYAVLGIGRDISDLRMLEAERRKVQKLESLGILAGGIAHDFNNFLTGIVGNISLAKTMVKPESEIFRILANSEKAANKACGLTRQLLTFSRGGAPVRENVSIAELLRVSSGFVLSGSNVNTEFDIPEDLQIVHADKGQISQVIQNIIFNSDQAMPDGGKIFIRAVNTEIHNNNNMHLNPGNYIRIEIHDQGTGIQEEHLSKIFDPFYTTKQRGSGLGLATAFSIIRKHEGSIIAESKLGIGSNFIIHLPSVEGTATGENGHPDLSAGHEERILIMDDKEMVRNTVSSMLEYLGYRVRCTCDGEKAIEEYSKAIQIEEPFDLVILDLTIPGGMGGTETLGELKKINPDIKAIVSSGYSTDPVIADYRKYGFMDIVVKPYSLGKISSALRKAIEE